MTAERLTMRLDSELKTWLEDEAKAAEQKRRAGKLERQDYARKLIFEAMSHTTTMEAFEAKLAEKNASYYIRGNQLWRGRARNSGIFF